MHYDHSDSLLSAAFKVVKQYDPKTYARMRSDDSWHVESMSVNDGYGRTMSAEANAELLGGEALTQINAQNIMDSSKRYSLHPALFAAAVLVHEYRHAHQSLAVVENTERAETQAFHAGSAFAAKLPGYDGQAIKAMSDETLKNMGSNSAYIMQDRMNNS